MAALEHGRGRRDRDEGGRYAASVTAPVSQPGATAAVEERPVSTAAQSAAAVSAALFVAALALRPQLIGVGPVATTIAGDLGISHAVTGLLTTLPVIGMAVFAPVGPLLARRLGARRAMLSGLLLLGVAGVARALAPTAAAFVVATAAIGVSTGVASALPSVLAKVHVPDRPGTVGGAATAGVIAGAVISAATIVPLASVVGGWRSALAVFAVLGLAASILSYTMLAPDRPETVVLRHASPQWRSPRAWLLAVVFGLQAVLYWGGGAWLAGSYIERGVPEASAAGLVALLNAGCFVASLAVAALSDRLGRRPLQIRVSAVLTLLATVGFVLVPDAAAAWTLVLGAGLGAIFPLLMIYTVDVSPSPTSAGSLSGFMLLFGYLIAAIGPIGLGAVRDVTGGFTATFPILTAVAASLVVSTLMLRPRPV